MQYGKIKSESHKYELESDTSSPKGIVALADYKATLVKD